MIRQFLMAICTGLTLGAFADSETTRSILFINEDWYGHENSTVNILYPDKADDTCWEYRVIQEANPGKELGCTNQYGSIFNGRLYLIAKQEKDPGADITGGRITVADAETLKIITQIQQIDPSGAQCDGRAFLGINQRKGYVSSSNGIWALNLETLEIEGQVNGSANPNAGQGNDRPPSDPTGSLYLGQSGTMVMAEGKVFAVHQQYGLLVIDPETDAVTDILDMEWVAESISEITGEPLAKLPGIGSTIVQSKDGFLWHSLSEDDQGLGSVLPYIVRVDPETLERELITINGNGDVDLYAPTNSWYAWTPDPFCASKQNNTLFWCGGSNRWFSKQLIFRFDIDNRELSVFSDLRDDPGNWNVYGCSMGIDPETDEIYASLFHEFQDPTYIVRRFAPDGESLKDYSMISHYWFPSLPLFTTTKNPSGIEISVTENSDSGDIYSLTGVRVAKDVQFGNWTNITPGIYIYRTSKAATKIHIK
ncbi:MAG: DUF5074 domain-containing protein [Muribaculaceae bacterium]|nr:DUF5074 domain-containing protein [Muribaculaceae bacterium]